MFSLILLIAGVSFLLFSQRKKETLLRAEVPLPQGPSILQVEPPLPNLVNMPLITAQPPSYELPYREEVIAYLKALEKILQDWAETEKTDIAEQQLQALMESLLSPEVEQNLQDTVKIYDYYISQKQSVLQGLLSLSPPPPCIELHYHYKTAFEDSIKAIAEIREGIYRKDRNYITSVLGYQTRIRRYMAQAEAEENNLRRIYGLPPRSFSIIY